MFCPKNKAGWEMTTSLFKNAGLKTTGTTSRSEKSSKSQNKSRKSRSKRPLPPDIIQCGQGAEDIEPAASVRQSRSSETLGACGPGSMSRWTGCHRPLCVGGA